MIAFLMTVAQMNGGGPVLMMMTSTFNAVSN